MRSVILAFLAFLTATVALAKPRIVTLTPSNFILLRGEIDDNLVSQVSLKLQLKQGESVYLYIDSPGGSIVDGMRLINLVKALSASGTEVICITDYAASMAFSLFQACPVRYAIENAIIMQHQASYGTQGSMTQNRSRIELVENITTKLNKMDSDRLQMPLDQFVNRIYKDWWLFDRDIVKYKAADELVLVMCDAKLMQEKVVETINSRFGTATVTWSACPVVTTPLAVKLKPASENLLKEFHDWFNSLPLETTWKERKEVK